MAPAPPSDTVRYVFRNAVLPAYALLPMKLNDVKATVMLLASGLQESRFVSRVQLNGGPAHGFWQNEKGGGVHGVLHNPASVALARELCEARGVDATDEAVYEAIVSDDVLAAGVARLILWCDPKPLPDVKDRDAAWDCYMRNWRPGKPHPETWAKFHNAARAAMGV